MDIEEMISRRPVDREAVEKIKAQMRAKQATPTHHDDGDTQQEQHPATD